jgi:subtilisin family serine protease
MPTQPGSEMDDELGGKPFDRFDETGKKDGWCVASGTSSATPQAAGVAALLLEAAKAKGQKLTTAQVRDILTQTAVSVQSGNNAFGFPATGHPNVAVGYGLIHAAAALAQVQAAGPQAGAPVTGAGTSGVQTASDNPVARP